ncbi:Hypothetical protein NocV09_02100560 [Nannochloropsis oceanica]
MWHSPLTSSSSSHSSSSASTLSVSPGAISVPHTPPPLSSQFITSAAAVGAVISSSQTAPAISPPSAVRRRAVLPPITTKSQLTLLQDRWPDNAAAPTAGAATAAAAAAGGSGAGTAPPVFKRKKESPSQQQQKQKRRQQPPVPHTPAIKNLVALLSDELPSLSPSLLLPLLPPSFLHDPDIEQVRIRLRFLKQALPGVNLSQVLPEAPRLLSYHGPNAPEMERLISERYHRLISVTQNKQDAIALIEAAPRALLLRDFDSRVLPYLELFTSALPGLKPSYLLAKHPVLLNKGINSTILPRLAALPFLLPSSLSPLSPKDLASLVRPYPALFTLPLPSLSTRLASLSLLLPPSLLLPTLCQHPRAWTADLSEVIAPQLHLLLASLGPTTTSSILHHLPSILYHPPSALTQKLDLLSSLLGGSVGGVNLLLSKNPMILAMDVTANVAPKLRFVRSLFPDLEEDDFVALLGTEAGSQCLTAAFGRLGRLSYLTQVRPGLSLEEGMKLVVCPSEELRRLYPGYENFLEDRIEPRFPTYTWEQLCALPFALREQAHGELLHGAYSKNGGSR